MAVTETTTESWGSRLGNSIKGVIVGLGLFVLASPSSSGTRETR